MSTFTKLTLENTNIKQSWKPMFMSFIELCKQNKKYKTYLDSLEEILIQYLQFTNNNYPNKNQIFKAFEFFEVSDCKVVILGQDPYHQPGQAMGLAFSVPNGIKIPPSLKNIYKEMVNDPKCNITIEPENGDLTHWAQQGVLLLNTALTVEYNRPNIHSKEWKPFTDFVIKWLSENANQSVTFMLWGGNAKKKEKLIAKSKQHEQQHIVLKANHPSPLSANKGGWFGCGHFGLTNSVIEW
jgi:uracil-DNA glycosylase